MGIQQHQSSSVRISKGQALESIGYLQPNTVLFNESRKLELRGSFKLYKMSKSKFQVIIVGGSIGGLTLAHCLRKARIDHIVLEKSSTPAPQIGASIGILPNGARVLDQLQLYDDIEGHIEPLSTATIGLPDGFSFSSSYPKIITQRSLFL